MPIDDESGVYLPPQKQYLDDLLVVDPALGDEPVPLWKSIAYNTAVLRNKMKHRADSAGAIAEQAGKGSGQHNLAPPLVADAASKDKDKAVMDKITAAIGDVEARLDRFEARRAEEAAQQARISGALALAERLAEEAPAELLDSLSPAVPQQRLH